MTTLFLNDSLTLSFPSSHDFFDQVEFTNSAFSFSATLTVSGREFDDVLFASDLTMTGSDGVNRLSIYGASQLSLAGWTISSWSSDDYILIGGTTFADFIKGSDLADVIVGDSGNNTLVGGGGNDYLGGGIDDDKMHGGGGDDVMDANWGNNVVHGGAGNDSLSGGQGHRISVLTRDRFFGAAGEDTIVAGLNHDKAYGGSGADVLGEMSTASGNRLYGNAGDDQLFGRAEHHGLYGGAGADVITATLGARCQSYGGNGNDTVISESGSDRLFGGNGDDMIVAGTFGNLIYGGRGTDQMTGGDGSDHFVLTNVRDSAVGVDHDVISGFVTGQDRIDLKAIASGQLFIDEAAFGSIAGQVRFDAASHLLQGNVNGDGIADYEIVLDQLGALAGSDLIL